MTVPLAANSAIALGGVADVAVGPAWMPTDAVCPRASAIWLATVRFQIRSYSFQSLPRSVPSSSLGVRNTSPAGRTASCASCAFFDLLA